MSESTEEKLSPRRKMANQLALELGGYVELPGLSVDLHESLTPVQKLLVLDAFGLCKGMATGDIESSQPRVTECLLRVVGRNFAGF